MKAGHRSPQIRRAVEEIRRRGWTVEFVPFCEDAETPGFRGQLCGVTVHARKAVKVRTRGLSRAAIAAILEHELEHVAGAERGTDRPEFGLRCGGTCGALGFMVAEHIKLLAPGVPVRFNTIATPHFFIGALASVVRIGLRSGDVVVDLLQERGAYRIGDEVQVSPAVLDLVPHWVVMCEVSGGVTGLRQAPLRDAGRILTYPREVDAAAAAQECLSRVSIDAKAKYCYWPVGRP